MLRVDAVRISRNRMAGHETSVPVGRRRRSSGPLVRARKLQQDRSLLGSEHSVLLIFLFLIIALVPGC